MTSRNHNCLYFLLFLLLIAVQPVADAFAQSKETLRELIINTDDDRDNDSLKTTKKEAENKDQCCIIKKNAYCRFVYADFGGSNVMSSADSKASSANGLCWAVGVQEAYKIPSGNKSARMFISAGLELRNYNAVATETDRFGGTAYNNLHYWYTGVPIIFQVLNTKYTAGKHGGWSYYGLAGVTTGLKIKVYNDYSEQGKITTYDISKHYTTFLLEPFLSGGLTYNTPACTYMVGPYLGYTGNNLITNTGISENILSYGLKFTALFLHN